MREIKTPAGGSTHLPGLGIGVVLVCSLEQMEFFSPTDGHPSAVYPELVVNVSGVRTQGAQGHYQFAGNVRATQVGSEQPQHVTLTFA